MRFMTIASIAVSAVLGILAVFLVRGMVNDKAAQSAETPNQPAIETVQIVIAARKIAFGDALKSRNLKLVPWPKANVPEGAFTSLEPFEEQDGTWRSALVRMAQNEPILLFKVSGEGQRQSLSSQIGVDMRAFAIRIDQTSGVGGFILPGDTVDVVLVRSLNGETRNKKMVSDLIVQNVRVLGVDQNADATSEKTKVAKTATVEVTIRDAQRLALATDLGDLTLILRRAGSAEVAPTRQIGIADLGTQIRKKPRTGVRRAKRAAPRRLQVAVIRPQSRELVSVMAASERQKNDGSKAKTFARIEKNLEGGVRP